MSLLQAVVLSVAVVFVASQLPPDFIPVDINAAENHTESACMQPMFQGPCKGFFQRFFYNHQTQSCEQFIYGGCRGNENNFYTVEDCQAKCVNN